MKTSAAGRALIIAREGRRLVAYRDTKGILTIGVGHTGRMSPPPVTAGMRITDEQCDAMLAADLAPVEDVLNRYVTVPMTQNEFDAMASLGFNIGVSGLRRSSVVSKLNLGDVAGAAQAFMMWSRPAALTSRRGAECKQFLTRDAPDAVGVSQSQAIAMKRVDKLAAKAMEAKAKTKAAQKDSAIVGAAGTAIATAAALHHSHVAWIVGGCVLAALVINGAIAWYCAGMAQTLTGNAAKQMEAAASFATPPQH